jgi:hypothetical protein
MNSPDPKTVERFVEHALRALPDRAAPGALEARVLAEIDRRAAQPWWAKSFVQWPAVVRAGFLVVSVVAAAVLAVGAIAFGTEFGAWSVAGQIAGRLPGVEAVREFAVALGSAAVAVGRSIPPFWLYLAVAALGGAYALLIALGAATYRTLASPRPAS